MSDDLIARLRGPLPVSRMQYPITTKPEWHTIPDTAVIIEWMEEAAALIEKLVNEGEEFLDSLGLIFYEPE